MTPKRLQILLLVSLLAMVALGLARSAESAFPPPPTGSCSPGPADCLAWHTSNVTVTWNTPPAGVTALGGCGKATVSSDTGGTPVGPCTWQSSTGETLAATLIVRRDATPPSVRGSADRDPDANGWYTRGVTFGFSGTDALSGMSGCSSASYSGPDSGAARISGTCSDAAGNTGSRVFEIKYDATAPTVEVKPERQADANGWYNHAVTVSFLGTDPASGVESCVAPVTYKGPDTAKAALSGTCRDKAGHTSAPAAFELKYDSKPPSLKRVNAEIGSRGVVLRWTASKDTLSYAVVRRPGLNGKKPSTLYNGPARAFTDRRLKAGVKYRYTVTAYDQAGNGAAKVLLAQPSQSVNAPTRTTPSRAKPALTRPAAGARVTVPPLLTWGRVPAATYYNVQLYRDGKKILTVWPRDAKFRLQRSWTYAGRAYTLTPGRYRWYLWAGFGPLSANRYGKLLGSRHFLVTRG